MNQQSVSIRTHRKSSIAGSLAAVVTAVALACGAGGVARAETVHGNIVAAERYRAPQASTPDVELGDTTVAQRLQNDAFLKVVNDRRTSSDRQAGDVTADRFKANPRNNAQADDLTADRMKANPRKSSQADDLVADRMKANPRHNPQADDLAADRMKANPRKSSQADDLVADRMKANPKN